MNKNRCSCGDLESHCGDSPSLWGHKPKSSLNGHSESKSMFCWSWEPAELELQGQKGLSAELSPQGMSSSVRWVRSETPWHKAASLTIVLHISTTRRSQAASDFVTFDFLSVWKRKRFPQRQEKNKNPQCFLCRRLSSNSSETFFSSLIFHSLRAD